MLTHSTRVEALRSGRPVMTLAEAIERGATIFALHECELYRLEVLEPGERLIGGEVRYSAAWLGDESSPLVGRIRAWTA